MTFGGFDKLGGQILEERFPAMESTSPMKDMRFALNPVEIGLRALEFVESLVFKSKYFEHELSPGLLIRVRVSRNFEPTGLRVYKTRAQSLAISFNDTLYSVGISVGGAEWEGIVKYAESGDTNALTSDWRRSSAIDMIQTSLETEIFSISRSNILKMVRIVESYARVESQ